MWRDALSLQANLAASDRFCTLLGPLEDATMLLMIDNYDSFTYNLVQYFSELGAQVTVHRNDALTVADVAALKPAQIVISPGPCTPNDAGISLALIDSLAGKVPIFGVCLGHQSIGQAFGGKVIRARKVMHGKTSMIHHSGLGVFKACQIHLKPPATTP